MEISSTESLSISGTAASEVVVSEPSVSSSSFSCLSSSSPTQASHTAFSTMDLVATTEAVDDEEDEEECAGSAEILGMQTIRFGIRAPAAGALSLFTRIASFNGLIIATLVYARFASILFHSPQEFVVGIAMKACHVLQFFLQLSFVLLVWLLTIPFITFWIWRLTFVRSFGEAQRLFLSHISFPVILTDCLYGFLLLASIVFSGFGGALKDYFRRLLELEEEEETDDEGDRNDAREANRNLAGEGNGDDADRGAAVGLVVNRNLEDVLARLDINFFEVEQIFDGLGDAVAVEDVPFNALVRMQGPVFHLFFFFGNKVFLLVANAFNVLSSNMIFFGVVIFVPFTLGRVILYLVSWLLTTVRDHAVTASMHFTDAGLSSEYKSLKIALTAVSNLTNVGQENGLLGQLTEMMIVNGSELTGANNTLSVAADLFMCSAAGTSKLSDVITLTVGYMFVVFLVFLYIGIIALIRYANSEPLTVSIVEAVPSLLRQFLAAMRHLMTMIKVAFFLSSVLGSSL